jgi:integrase
MAEVRRVVRRPLTADELRSLIATTRTAPSYRRVTGVDRAMLYHICAGTGFRRSEAGSLTPEDFDLSGPRPTVSLDGLRTKNGKACSQPLTASLVRELRHWLATKAPRRLLFNLPYNTGMMLRADLTRCEIEPRDEQGRIVDMHSLRHTYGTTLALSGVSPRIVQELMRHSDIRLTMEIYTHLSAFDLHSAVAAALPDLTEAPQKPAQHRTA